ncbi:MAG: phospholipase D-like domain-containing protein [Lautropia sp.]|nr:phospholipase D-like domain-containing protein [Lautropia sp.]
MLISDHAIVVLVSLLIYVTVTRIGRHRRAPSAAFAWVLLLVAFPYLGLPLFLLFGTRKLWRRGQHQPPLFDPFRKLAAERTGIHPVPTVGWAAELLASMDVPAPSCDGDVRFQVDGAAAFIAVLKLIADARQSLSVCSYLLGQDAQAEQVIRSLRAAALRGVEVRLLLDAVGAFRVTRTQYQALLASGVEVRRYMPLLHNPVPGRVNLRNHRKLLIVDETRVWAGGRNLAAEYFSGRPGEAAWIDLSFTMTGGVVADALRLFDKDWRAALPLPERLRRHGRAAVPVPATTPPRPALVEPFPDVAAGPPAKPFVAEGEGQRQPHLQLIPSGPDLFDDTVYALLLAAGFHARKRIVAVTPYFVPDEALLTAWCLAARRGVRITLLVPGRSNHRLADLARMRALRQLVQVGAEVRLHPGMIHAKAVVVDDALALAGSLNLDSRSMLLNFEVMFAFYRRQDIEWLMQWIEAHCNEAALQDGSPPRWHRDLLEGMVRALAYQL